jgi:hypothetical protein
MTKTMEQAAWHKGKRPLVDEYLQNAKQVEAVVSGRGHLYRPGFLGEMVTDVERGFKFKLSDLNYNITKEAIERELAQTGHDYDDAYKTAAIAWELEKTTLLTALSQEFADNKAVRELDKQQLDRLEITTNLRKLVIMAAKVAIDEDMEEYRQELTLVEESTFPAEDALLAAKLLTAQHKLDVIPYIETVLEKQQLIIDAETINATRKETLIDKKEDLNDKRLELITAKELIAAAIIELVAAKQELVTKRQTLITAKGLIATQEETNVTYLDQYILSLAGLRDVQQDLVQAKKDLIPFLTAKSLRLIAYAAELDAWVIVKDAIALIKEERVGHMETRADLKGDIIDAKVDLNDLKLDLQEAEIDLKIARLTGRSDLLIQQTGNIADMLTERETSFRLELARESELVGGKIDLDLHEAQKVYETMRDVNDITIPSQLEAQRDVGAYRIITKRTLGNIASGAELTSQLIHQLS